MRGDRLAVHAAELGRGAQPVVARDRAPVVRLDALHAAAVGLIDRGGDARLGDLLDRHQLGPVELAEAIEDVPVAHPVEALGDLLPVAAGLGQRHRGLVARVLVGDVLRRAVGAVDRAGHAPVPAGHRDDRGLAHVGALTARHLADHHRDVLVAAAIEPHGRVGPGELGERAADRREELVARAAGLSAGRAHLRLQRLDLRALSDGSRGAARSGRAAARCIRRLLLVVQAAPPPLTPACALCSPVGGVDPRQTSLDLPQARSHRRRQRGAYPRIGIVRDSCPSSRSGCWGASARS